MQIGGAQPNDRLWRVVWHEGAGVGRRDVRRRRRLWQPTVAAAFQRVTRCAAGRLGTTSQFSASATDLVSAALIRAGVRASAQRRTQFRQQSKARPPIQECRGRTCRAPAPAVSPTASSSSRWTARCRAVCKSAPLPLVTTRSPLEQLLMNQGPAGNPDAHRLAIRRPPPFELSLSPDTGVPGTTVTVSGTLTAPLTQRSDYGELCWDGCPDGLEYQGVDLRWTSPTTFQTTMVVPAAPWLKANPPRVAPLVSGTYSIGIHCLNEVKGCELARLTRQRSLPSTSADVGRCVVVRNAGVVCPPDRVTRRRVAERRRQGHRLRAVGGNHRHRPAVRGPVTNAIG